MDAFEDTLAAVASLALFVPLLIGTGGNAGAQSATTVVRAMAVGDLRFAWPQPRGRQEAATGCLLGSCLAVIGFVPAALLVDVDVAAVLCLALVAVCTLATTAGSVTPMVAKRLGVDPAVVSAPFITTFVDATGPVVYFSSPRRSWACSNAVAGATGSEGGDAGKDLRMQPEVAAQTLAAREAQIRAQLAVIEAGSKRSTAGGIGFGKRVGDGRASRSSA